MDTKSILVHLYFLFGLITLKNFSLITSYTLDIQLSGFGHNLYPLIVLLVLFFDSTLKLTQREKICKQYCNIFFHKYGCFLFLIFLTSFSPFMINNSFFLCFSMYGIIMIFIKIEEANLHQNMYFFLKNHG